MRKLIDSHHFAAIELILVLLCGAVWMTRPEWGIWFILIALCALSLRLITKGFAFTFPDWLVIIFVITAWAGYWAAIDQAIAWRKAWLIVSAGLLYFSLREQPRQNLVFVALLLFGLGVGVTIYFFLTHDFLVLPRKIDLVNQFGRWLMTIRPDLPWHPIHPNYVAGMIAITLPFVGYPIWRAQRTLRSIPVYHLFLVLAGSGLSLLALVMATSRGVFYAILCGWGGGDGMASPEIHRAPGLA